MTTGAFEIAGGRGPASSASARVVACLAAFAAGTHLPLRGPVTLTAVVCVALLPIWVPAVNKAIGPVVTLLGVSAVANGLLLSAISASAHPVSQKLANDQVALIAELVLGIGVLIWVRETVGSERMATLFGLGLLVGQLARGLNHENPWKFSLSIPVIVTMLGLCWWGRWFRAELVILLALTAVSAALDSRSAASICFTAFLILAMQRARAVFRLRSTRVQVAADILGIALISFWVMQVFILDGLLGAAAQARTEVQVQESGSVILGGRPELAATVALLTRTPAGFGFGVIPLLSDLNVAKAGMAAIGYDPNNGYVDVYMLGGGFEVHSIIGDLWLDAGVFGLALGLALIGFVLKGAFTRLAEGRGLALTTLLAVQVLWDALFSPLALVGVQVLTLAVALLAYPDISSDDSTPGLELGVPNVLNLTGDRRTAAGLPAGRSPSSRRPA